MKNLQKMGGIASLYEAAAYLMGIVFFKLVLDFSGVIEPIQMVALLVDNQSIMYAMNIAIYVVFGIFMVILALALYERLKDGSPAIARITTVFALIWACVVIASGMIYNTGIETITNLYHNNPAQAATVWLAISSVQEGIGGGNEILGGLWSLLVSLAALLSNQLPRFLNYLGLLIGTAGILSAIPALGEAGGAIFGLGQIVWFIWLGIVMLRSTQNNHLDSVR